MDTNTKAGFTTQYVSDKIIDGLNRDLNSLIILNFTASVAMYLR